MGQGLGKNGAGAVPAGRVGPIVGPNGPAGDLVLYIGEIAAAGAPKRASGAEPELSRTRTFRTRTPEPGCEFEKLSSGAGLGDASAGF